MSESVPNHWWKYDRGDKLGAGVIAAVNNIQETTRGLQERYLRCFKAFGGQGYMSGGRFPTNTGQGGALGMGQRQGPRDNLIYAGVSACASLILQDGQPGVAVATNHGNYEEQHRAELLEQYFDGIAYKTKLDAASVKQLVDALIVGTGWKKFWIDQDATVHVDRVFPGEMFVDIWDGRDQSPRSLYQVGFIDRDVLAARYRGMRKQIMDIKPQIFPWLSVTATSQTNVIPFVEAWRLPDSEDKPGRHVLTLANDLVVLDEKYAEEDFPFTVLRFEELPTGFHGMGIAELGAGHQLSLNNANTAEYWAWSQVAAPRIWAAHGSLNRDHLNSSLSGIILEGRGAPPTVLNWTATHPAFVEWKNDLRANFFALLGLSSMTVAGVKPSGLDSGEAQREYKATLNGRFSVFSQRWAELRCDDFRKLIALSRRASELEPDFSVRVMGKGYSKRIKFTEAELEEDEYRIRAKPVSSLPKTAAGQIQTATELLQSQLADIDTARSIITAIPDLGAAADEYNAAFDNARRTAYLMLHEGIPQTPDGAIQNLALCQKVITAETLRAIDNDAPPDRIKLCLNWLVQAKAQSAPSPALGAAPGGAPPGPAGSPLAQGAPLPQSSALPFKQPR